MGDFRKIKPVKDECFKCRSWTKELKHGSYKCYTNTCPAKKRDTAIKAEAKKRAAWNQSLSRHDLDK